MAVGLTNPPYDPISPIPSYSNCTNQKILLKANTPYTFLAANTSRAYALIQNVDKYPITVLFGIAKNAIWGQGMLIYPYTGQYEINQNSLYLGPLTAISLFDCNISFLECSWS